MDTKRVTQRTNQRGFFFVKINMTSISLADEIEDSN